MKLEGGELTVGETKKEESKVETKKQLKFRYACPHCTERALYATEPKEFKSITCLNCKKPINQYDPGNWLPVTDEKELIKIN